MRFIRIIQQTLKIEARIFVDLFHGSSFYHLKFIRIKLQRLYGNDRQRAATAYNPALTPKDSSDHMTNEHIDGQPDSEPTVTSIEADASVYPRQALPKQMASIHRTVSRRLGTK